MGATRLSSLKQEKGEQVTAVEMEKTDTVMRGLLVLGFGALVSLISTCGKH